MFVLWRSHHNPILAPYRDHYWEDFAVFNMSVVKRGKFYYGVYRALGGEDSMRTPKQMSVIGIARSKDVMHFDGRTQFITPSEEWDKYGCEDPRITYFEGKYYTFYTALSKYPFEASGIKVAVAISKDLKKVDEKHLVTPFNAKAMALFPERVNGKVTVILTANTDSPPAKIAIAQADKIEDLWDENFWKRWYANIDEYVLNFTRNSGDHVEVGAAPLKTKHGWLLIYSHIKHYFDSSVEHERVFGIEALLLDSVNPTKIIGQTLGPMMTPREPYELVGHVSDIVFPSGAIIEGDMLHIYYGAADTAIGIAHVNLTDLISSMRKETQERWYFKRGEHNPIISPDKIRPWESKAVFNPAAIMLKKKVHLLYRALSDDNTSTIGYAESKDGLNISERHALPIYVPREDFEMKKVSGGNSGCEDPRLTKIGNTIYMCYTAFDGIGPPRVALTSISVKDFLNKKWRWSKPVLITPPGLDDKDTCILPEKINGKYFVMHRVGNEICGDYVKSLNFKNEMVDTCIRIIGPRKNTWDSSKVGITAPPIKTRHGWLLLYHGVSKSHSTYRLGAVLLDLKDPAIVLARTSDPIFWPQEKYEKEGVVNNVVFPCGMILKDKTLYIYYGGADTVIGVATMNIDIILRALTRNSKRKRK